MEMWHFKEDEEEEEEEDPEKLDLLQEEQVPLENIIDETPSQIQKFSGQTANPFLEQEPVENLEQELQQIPAQSEQDKETADIEQPMLYNAPQYSGSYDSGDYENTRSNTDMERDVSGGSLTTRETTIQPASQRGVNIAAWQQGHVNQMQEQQEKYQVGKAKKLSQQGDLPFQSENKPRGFG